jgi:gas vesicle protein
MNKNLFPIYGIIAGVGLSYLYIKTLGKDKNLNLTNNLLIGAGIGAGIGSLITLMSNNSSTEEKKEPKIITEQSLKDLANETNSALELQNYLDIIERAKVGDKDKQRIFNVINGVLLAKKDKKWDEFANMKTKKNILLGYNVSEYDFNVFQDVMVNKLADIISDVINK